MPFTKKQRALFNAAAHDPDIAREHDMRRGTATTLADEANRLKGEGKERKPVEKANVGFIDLTPIYDHHRK